MTGPEHYRQAERMLSSATKAPMFEDGTSPWATRAIAFAQVHATLAVAAATAMGADPSIPDPDWAAWKTAAAVQVEPNPGEAP